MNTRNLALWLSAAVVAAAATPSRAQYQLSDAFPGLSFVTPVDIQHAGDPRLFVAEKDGRIWVIDGVAKSLFLDISSRVASIGEAGLLGMAFSPHDASHFYVFYVTADTTIRSVVSRFTVSAGDPNAADASSEVEILQLEQPDYFHNGGQLAFDPADGTLYISIGDWKNQANAQDCTTLAGAILRIDVRYTEPGKMYYVPNDNPFHDNAVGFREEIWAWGFRNPWRMSFDRLRRRLWVGDVGQDAVEEIDRVRKGRNYGWPLMEGTDCYSPWWCDTTSLDLALPEFEYDHTLGKAVIGGQVYRGIRLWGLNGRYIFADWSGGRVWALDADAAVPGPAEEIISGAPFILAIGAGADGELYVAGGDGILYRIDPIASAADAPARTTGTRLEAPFPNPFNPATTVPYTLDGFARVSLQIHDTRGRLVRTLIDGKVGPGPHQATWDGKDFRDIPVASGVYFASLRVNGVLADRARLVLLK